MAFADWSESQVLPLFPEVLARKWWNFKILTGCWSFGEDPQYLKVSWVAFPEWSHDLAKKVNSKSFRRPGQWTRTRIKYGPNTNIKIIVKRGQWEKARRLSSYCLSLDPTSKPHKNCVSCFSVVPGLSAYFNNRGMMIIWYLDMFSSPQEVKG